MEEEIDKKIWVQDPILGNYFLDGENFYISFNGNCLSEHGRKCETALVTENNYYILDGDWRREYESIIDNGFEACYKFFKDNEEDFVSSWSD